LPLSDVSILLAIAKALQTANIDDPMAADGKIRDQSVLSDAHSVHLAKAAIRGMNAAGFAVISTHQATPNFVGQVTLEGMTARLNKVR
jgi:hypothetical protein